MAVYYKWIKGCASGADLKTGAWTYITWGTKVSSKANEALPKLTIQTGRDSTEAGTDLGYFLTNKVDEVQIWKNWDWVLFHGWTGENCGIDGFFTVNNWK